MMKIVILTGGTGSIALQQGLHDTLERHLDGVETTIIVNAYDNGLSTGAVRQVMDGRILGPSDVRKNQTTRIRLRDPTDPWLGFLECRVTVEVSRARERCELEVARLVERLQQSGRVTDCATLLLESIARFFQAPLSGRIRYDDFSLSNIIYAGLAAANGNSLRTAARVMADAMNLPDNVLLNDDTSLFLGAVTRSGQRITDEGDIVKWGRDDDPIVDIFFLDAHGNEARPELCVETWKAILDAQLIVLSAGTQWSSLIPTYASHGFAAAIRASGAKVLMVMNRSPDKDSPGQTAADIINVLVPRYFDEMRLHVLIDANGAPRMRHLDHNARAKVASVTEIVLSDPEGPPDKHDPVKLVNAIGYVYFKEYVDSDLFLFDYDDTLCGRESRYPKSSQFNIKGVTRLNRLTQIGICTGNTINALTLTTDQMEIKASSETAEERLLVFADGGANEYSCGTRRMASDAASRFESVRCISPDAMFPATGSYSAEEIMSALKRAGIPESKIENRGNAVIAIKPIASEERRAVIHLARHIVSGSDLHVVECGRTTIEIRRRALSKVAALQHLCARSTNGASITYVGDELDSGNDREIQDFSAAESRVKCLHVENPAHTAFFIHTLTGRLQR